VRLIEVVGFEAQRPVRGEQGAEAFDVRVLESERQRAVDPDVRRADRHPRVARTVKVLYKTAPVERMRSPRHRVQRPCDQPRTAPKQWELGANQRADHHVGAIYGGVAARPDGRRERECSDDGVRGGVPAAA
jgi:hypothetical protein